MRCSPDLTPLELGRNEAKRMRSKLTTTTTHHLVNLID